MKTLEIKTVSLAERLNNIRLTCQSGDFVHLIGPNGAGKSTLLQVMAGLLPTDAGQVIYAGRAVNNISLSELATFRTLQEQGQSSVFPVKVIEALQFFVGEQKDIPELLEQALEIYPFMQKSLLELSGGELRRVQIARALLQIWPAVQQGDGLILLDEPLQGLDLRHQSLLMKLLTELAEKGNIVIISNHDINLCYRYASRVCLLNNGEMQTQGDSVDVMRPEVLSEVFNCLISIHTTLEGKKIFQTVENDR